MDDTTLAQRRVLACAAILNERNGDDHVRIGGASRPGSTRRMAHTIARWWDVRTPEEALETLEMLESRGHRFELAARGAGSVESFLAWDLCRIVSFAGQAHVAYLLDAEAAWTWMRRAAVALQKAFGSFAELGQSYLRGARSWAGRGSDVEKETEAAIAKLLAADEGPFRLPWDLPIDEVPCPADATREVAVKPGDSLLKAIEEAGESGRVVLLAGEHPGSVTLPFPVEIVAEAGGAALLSGGAGPTLRVGPRISAVLRGARVESRHTPEGATLNAIHVNGGFAILEGCDIQSTHHGVAVVGDGDARMADCHVHDCARCGVIADPGDLVLSRVRVSNVGVHGVSRAGGGQLTILRDLAVSGAAQTALFAAGPVLGEKVALAATGALGLVAAGSVLVNDLALTDVVSRGILVQNGATLSIGGGSVSGGAMPQVDVLDGLARLHRLTLSGGTGGGVLVQSKGALHARGCSIDVPEQGGVQLLAGGRAAIADSRVRAGWPVVATGEGASLWWMDGEIQALRGNGVDASDSADIIVSDCSVTSPENGVRVAGSKARVSRCVLAGCGGAAVKAEDGALLLLEDLEEKDNALPDDLESATRILVTGADPVSVDVSDVAEREGQFAFRISPPSAWDHVFQTRGPGPTPQVVARALAIAAVSPGTPVSAGVDDDGALVLRARTEEVAKQLHEYACLVARCPADMRLFVDRVDFLDRVEAFHGRGEEG